MIARAEGKKTEIESIEEAEESTQKLLSYPKSILCIVGGAAAIAFGGDLTVDAASRIAIDLGMSQTLVGLTIVSIGTSLPELVTSLVAARKNEIDMAVGNAVGSNIFNILMVLGIAASISPVALITVNLIDILVLIGFSILVLVYAITNRKVTRSRGRVHGVPVSDLHHLHHTQVTAVRRNRVEYPIVLCYHRRKIDFCIIMSIFYIIL